MGNVKYFGVACVELDGFGCVSDGVAILLEFDIGLGMIQVSEGGPKRMRFRVI